MILNNGFENRWNSYQRPTAHDGRKSHNPTFGQNTIGASSFKTKYKEFALRLIKDGGSVRIAEKTRSRNYEISVTIDAAFWLVDSIGVACKNGKPSSIHTKFKNSAISLWIERFKNNRGEFLQIYTLRYNMLKSIIVPSEENYMGWRKLAQCLQFVLGRKIQQQRGNLARSGCDFQPNQRDTSKEMTGMRSWANVVKIGATNKEKQFQNQKHIRGDTHRTLKKATDGVLMFRESSHISWEAIQNGLENTMKKCYEVRPLHDDRAIIWCQNEGEKHELIKLRRLKIPAGTTVVFAPWSWKNQYEEIKIDCRYSWVGIEGLPLNLWNIHVFKAIGSLCGGLLDIDKDTLELNFLNHARLKLRGSKQGFIQESMALPYNSSKITVKFFNLNDRTYRFHGTFGSFWHEDSNIKRTARGPEEDFFPETTVEEEFALPDDKLEEKHDVANVEVTRGTCVDRVDNSSKDVGNVAAKSSINIVTEVTANDGFQGIKKFSTGEEDCSIENWGRVPSKRMDVNRIERHDTISLERIFTRINGNLSSQKQSSAQLFQYKAPLCYAIHNGSLNMDRDFKVRQRDNFVYQMKSVLQFGPGDMGLVKTQTDGPLTRMVIGNIKENMPTCCKGPTKVFNPKKKGTFRHATIFSWLNFEAQNKVKRPSVLIKELEEDDKELEREGNKFAKVYSRKTSPLRLGNNLQAVHMEAITQDDYCQSEDMQDFANRDEDSDSCSSEEEDVESINSIETIDDTLVNIKQLWADKEEKLSHSVEVIEEVEEDERNHTYPGDSNVTSAQQEASLEESDSKWDSLSRSMEKLGMKVITKKSRELKKLAFNVNYDRPSSQKGKAGKYK